LSRDPEEFPCNTPLGTKNPFVIRRKLPMLRSTLKERTIGRKLATQEEKGEATRMAKRMSKR